MHKLRDVNGEKICNDSAKKDIKNLIEWTEDLFDLNYDCPPVDFYIFNNFIYYVHFGYTVGSEQAYDRPALVVHTTKESPVCIVIPITNERLNDKRPYHVDLSNGIGTALIEQIRTISKKRIYAKLYVKNKHATITEEDRVAINEQLSKLCQLKEIWQPNK